MRNSLQACECQESLRKQIGTWLIAEEYAKLSGRLNTITINNSLTKVDFKVLVYIPIFGRFIRRKHKQANKSKDYITKLSLSQPAYKAVPLRPQRMTISDILTDGHTCNALLSLGNFQYSARQTAVPPPSFPRVHSLLQDNCRTWQLIWLCGEQTGVGNR